MEYTCAYCQKHCCFKNKMDDAPVNCPTKNESLKLNEVFKKYYESENLKIAKVSAEIVIEGIGVKTRVQEIVDFCKTMGYKKLGLAFCAALSREAYAFAKILNDNGFDVESVVCKLGSVKKSELGIEDNGVMMCNPIAQAEFLNDKKTEFNIILGLCVGHDTLFIKYSSAPITVLAVKDRALSHNPVAALK